MSEILYRKDIRTELKGITAVAANAQSKSSEIDIVDDQDILLFIDHARDSASAPAGAGTEYKIETSQKASGNDTWRTLQSYVCEVIPVSSIVMDAEKSAGSTRIETGATLPEVGGHVFFKNATIANSEWALVTMINATIGAEYFDILDGLTHTQAPITLFNRAEHLVLSLNVMTAKRLRVICNNNNGSTNRAIVWRCACISRRS